MDTGPGSAVVETWTVAGTTAVPLVAASLTIGKDAANDVVLPADPTVSRLHAVLRRYPAGWCVGDLDSRNGTWVNGERVVRERPLRDGDEIRVGACRLVFRDRAAGGSLGTDVAEAGPVLTRRERDVLLALCAPMAAGDEPASTRAVAEALVVTEAAIKQHLLRLYAKLGVTGAGRRASLAVEALRRGVVTLPEVAATDRERRRSR